jgi:hypothetical protein
MNQNKSPCRKINLRCTHYFDFIVKIATHHSFMSSSLPFPYFNNSLAASRCLRFTPYEAISYGFIFCFAKTSRSLFAPQRSLCRPSYQSSVPSFWSDFVSLHALPLQRSFSQANLKIFYQYKKS